MTLGAMVVVGVLVALVVDRAARRAQQAERARAEAALLASFARTVLTRTDPLPRLLEKVRESFGLSSVALLERGAEWRCVASSGPLGCRTPEDADVDVAVEDDLHLVGSGGTLAAADRRLLEVVGGQALLALRSQRAAAQAEESASARRGHRDPQRAAVGGGARPAQPAHVDQGGRRQASATPSLPLPPADRLELTASIEESADRLTALVDNLLDSSRLAAGAVTPLLAPVGYDEVAVRAMAGLDGAGRVALDIDEALPDVLADAGLLERVVANVVDNALRYAGDARSCCAAAPTANGWSCVSSTPGPGCPSANGKASSSRSGGWGLIPATATGAPGSGWGSRSRGGSRR